MVGRNAGPKMPPSIAICRRDIAPQTPECASVLPDRIQTNRVIPLATGRCRVTFDHFHPPDVEDLESRHARDQAFSGLESDPYHAGRLNRKRKNGVHHFHELRRGAYAPRVGRGAAMGSQHR